MVASWVPDMRGLKVAEIRAHPSLIPLYVCGFAGSAIATWYIYRMVARDPDCSINRKGNPAPYQKFASTYRFKLFSFNQDYNKLPERKSVE